MANKEKLICPNCGSRLKIIGGEQIESVKITYTHCFSCNGGFKFQTVADLTTSLPDKIFNILPNYSNRLKKEIQG